jgi:hypothetical protein
MNITCIHLRVKGSYIYMYRRGGIYKEPLEKYNNRKTNTYLIKSTLYQPKTFVVVKLQLYKRAYFFSVDFAR